MKFSIISRNDLIILTAFMIAQGSARFQCTFDCCYVNFLRQQFAKPVTDLSRTGCCKIEGVSCDGESVTKINWSGKQLTGEIPRFIWKLANLSSLDLSNNKITGKIPRPDEPVLNLRSLVLSNNDLRGKFDVEIDFPVLENLKLKNNPKLIGYVRISKNLLETSLELFSNTKLLIAGPAAIFANPGSHLPNPKNEQRLIKLATLRPTEENTPIQTLLTFGINLGINSLAIQFKTDSYGTFTCARSYISPARQDCINTIAAFCQTSSPLFSTWTDCHDKVKAIRNVWSWNWKSYINSCAKFSGGNPTSQACIDAKEKILDESLPSSLADDMEYIWYT